MAAIPFGRGAFLCVATVLLVFGLSAVPAAATDRVGVVVLHGKGGMPQGQMMRPLISALESAGFLVSTPEMTWSRNRGYDVGYDRSMAEISEAVAELRERGASQIVVAGQSQGANAALGFGARFGGVAGIAAVAPGHVPEYLAMLSPISEALARAKALIAAGRGDERSEYPEFDPDGASNVIASAADYASFFDPDGPAVMSRNAAALKPGIALLWIYGERDRPNVRRGRDYAFDRAPAHPKSRYLVIEGGHGQTSARGASQIVDWIRSLRQRTGLP